MVLSLARRGIVPGLQYVAIIFAIGFAFGVLRELWAAQALGRLTAELVELPTMIALSWLVCGWLVRRRSITSEEARVAMVGTALVGLILLETLVAVFVRRMSIPDYLDHLTSLSGLLAWSGYLAFAFAPLFVAR